MGTMMVAMSVPIWWWAGAGLLGCNGSADFDGDGFVEPADCNDADANTYPGAPEIAYDGRDQDCDGSDLVDRDGDGYRGIEADGTDCNDFDPKVYPGAREIPYDGVDGNCDGWNDDDFDQDGFVAMGHGGDDCDDEDPRITPLDLDGDGYSPCTGDCDEGDERRNENATPVCGNGVDDDCDGISDCTPTGLMSVDDFPVHISAGEGLYDFGSGLVAPGDIDGDGSGDLVVTANREEGGSVAFLLSLPLPELSDPSSAWASLVLPGPDPWAHDPGDVDGDGRADLLLADPGTEGHAWIVADPDLGESDIGAAARLELVTTGTLSSPPQIGRAVARLGADLVIGAPGLEEIQILPASTTGTRVFGEDGAVLDGAAGAGMAVHAADTDGDGVDELLIGASGGTFIPESALYRLVDPPRSGIVNLVSRAEGALDLRDWGQSTLEIASGDLDDDGRDDTVVAVPFEGSVVGAIAVLYEPVSGASAVEDVQTQRLGLGDDTFGWVTLVEDFDGDGIDDLIAGSPSLWGSVGGADKPGAVFLWYGPLEAVVEHSISADLYIQGTYTGHRTFTGHALALADVDGDTGRDLLIGSPHNENGRVDVLLGGLSGLLGM